MNYYQARQREMTGRWDFTVKNDDMIRAVGYCAGYKLLDPAKLPMLPAESVERENAEVESQREKYHTDGHDTQEEAERCWYNYDLDRLIPVEFPDAQYRCEVCQVFTQHGLRSRAEHTLVLCDEHRNREGFERARPFHAGVFIMSSW